MASEVQPSVESLRRELRSLESAYAELEESRAALARSEARYQRVFENIQDVYFEATLDGWILEVSPSVQTLFGLDPTDLIDTRAAWLAVPLFDQPHLRDQLAKRRRVRDLALELVDAHGQPRPCVLNARVIQSDTDADPRIVGSIAEISDRVEIERQLRASEERFRSIFFNSPDAMLISDAVSGVLIDVNEGFEQSTGWRRDEVIGKRALDLGLWDERVAEATTSLLERHGEIRSIENRFRTKTGNQVTALVSAKRVDFEGQHQVLWTARSIEELKRSQVESQRVAAKFEVLFEYAADAISLQNGEGLLLDVNAALCERLGRSRRELVGTPWLELHAPSHQPAARRAMETVQAEGACMFETVQVDAEGIPRTVEVSLRRIVLDEETAVMAIARDVTQRRALETQLMQSQKMEAVGLLASGVAHDFNNILTVIRGLAFVLKDALPEDHEDQDTIDDLDRSAERAAGLTRQLLAFSRRQVTNPEDVDAGELIKNLSKMLRRLLPAVIDLELDLDADETLVHADAGQLEQVVANLVVNAKDATMGAGKITIGCHPQQRSTATRAVDGSEIPPGHYVAVHVADTGAGIDRDAIDRIFEPFYTTKAKGKGTGLGLATVRDIVQRSHGFIEVESTLGQGSTFRVLLPALDEAPERMVIPAPDTLDVRGTERVLIVDDEAALRSILRDRFERLGYEAHAAQDPTEALSVLDGMEGPLDLLVTDLVMPQSTGTDLAAAVRARLKNVRVLFMSGYADDDVLAALPRDNASDFIQKVFTPDALLRRARALLDRA